MSQAIDLTPSQREKLLSLLSSHLPNTEVWVYGSRARWTSRQESDFDMAVFATPAQARGVSALREALEESNLPFRVDLFVWDEVPESFRKQIQREHVVLAEASVIESTWQASRSSGSSDIRTEWRESTWGEEITLEYGKALRGHDSSTGAYRVFGSNGPIGWTDKALATGPGVILGRKGAYRGVEYSPDPYFVIDTAYYVVPKSQHDMRWLYYAIKYHRLGEIDDGSPIPSTTRSAVYPRKLAVPSPNEQRAIAHILGTLDDKIELNRRMNETLEAMARALFKSWFVDFDSVRAKMNGDNSGLPDHIAKLFPDRLNDQGRPKGWTLQRLDRLFDVSIGRTPPRKERQHFVPGGKGETWLSIKTMGNAQTFAMASEEDLTAEAIERFRIPRIPAGTVMVSFKLTVGRVAIAAHEMYSNEAIAHLRARSDTPITSPFTYCYMKGFDYGRLGSTSSIATAVNSKSIKAIEMVLPDTATHAAFETVARPIFDRILRLSREIVTLENIRDQLLPRLVSGDIRVQEAEKAVADVL